LPVLLYILDLGIGHSILPPEKPRKLIKLRIAKLPKKSSFIVTSSLTH